MVEHQIRRRGLRDELVLGAMLEVPRHLFVESHWVAEAYGDHAFPIGHGQTISQPYIVALMTSLLEPTAGLKVLEVGTGAASKSTRSSASPSCRSSRAATSRRPAASSGCTFAWETEARDGPRKHPSTARS
jgi:hypothetical protein